MLYAGCILFGIIAIKGATLEPNPPDYADYDRIIESTDPVENLEYFRQDRIIGGHPIEIYEYPSTVYVLRRMDELVSHGCAGSIVTQRWIVTAGHCVHGAHPSDVTIMAGMTTLDSGGIKYTAEHYVIHHGYKRTGKSRAYDVACVRVLGAFALDGTSIAIAILPKDGVDVATGDKLEMLGWGFTELGQSRQTTALHTIEVEVLDQEECSELLPNVDIYMFCTASLLNGVHKGGMPGDSGGPLFDGHTLVGMHVSGYRSERLAIPDKNVRITFFKQWILETTG